LNLADTYSKLSSRLFCKYNVLTTTIN